MNPQELLNRESQNHSNPDADNTHQLIEEIGNEVPNVDDFDADVAWSTWSLEDVLPDITHVNSDHVELFASDEMSAKKTKPSKYYNEKLGGCPKGTKNRSMTTSSSDC